MSKDAFPVSSPTAASLNRLREQVDALDAQLLTLLAERQRLTDQVAAHKRDADDVRAYPRLLAMLEQRRQRAEALGLDSASVVKLFHDLAHAAMHRQRNTLAISTRYRELPLVYACSGCSSAAQLANDVALALDREGVAEMSCIAGVGGDVDALTQVATQPREMLVLDGCKLQCAKRSLARHGRTPEWHLVLSDIGVRKRLHQPWLSEDFLRVHRLALDRLGQTAEAPVINRFARNAGSEHGADVSVADAASVREDTLAGNKCFADSRNQNTAGKIADFRDPS